MWRRVCRLSDLPLRQGYLVELEGRAVALFRVGDGVHAIDNTCPHREAPLAFGDLRGTTVFCPLHAWPFDVTTGRCLDLEGVAVERYEARVTEGGDVEIAL